MAITDDIEDAPTRDPALNLVLLQNLIETAKASNATVVFFYSSKFEALPDEIRRLLHTHGRRVVYVNSAVALPWRITHHGETILGLMNPTNHFTRRGNEIYAEVIAGILKRRLWASGGRRFEYAPDENAFRRLPPDG